MCVVGEELWGLQEEARGRGPRGGGLTKAAVAHHPYPPRDPVKSHVLESGGLRQAPALSCSLPPLPSRPGQWLIFEHLTLDPLQSLPSHSGSVERVWVGWVGVGMRILGRWASRAPRGLHCTQPLPSLHSTLLPSC